MAVYPKAFTDDDFTQLSDGRYMATLPATTHNLGTNFHVAKNIKRDPADMSWHNVVPVFRILSNGDFEFYVNELGTYKIYLVGE